MGLRTAFSVASDTGGIQYVLPCSLASHQHLIGNTSRALILRSILPKLLPRVSISYHRTALIWHSSFFCCVDSQSHASLVPVYELLIY